MPVAEVELDGGQGEPRRRWWTWPLGRSLSWPRELVLIAILYIAYDVTRVFVPQHNTAAVARGLTILRWEHGLHLDPEVALNAALSGVRSVALACDYFYATLHYLVTPAVLIWLYRCHKANYRSARRTLIGASLIGLSCFWLLPTAPPRLLPYGDFIDTMARWSAYGWWGSAGSVPDGLGHLSNQLAAMPSLHVGWALWCGYYVARYARRRPVRLLGALYPVATTIVVLTTGNHYLLDAVAGVLTIGAGAFVTHRFGVFGVFFRGRSAVSSARPPSPEHRPVAGAAPRERAAPLHAVPASVPGQRLRDAQPQLQAGSGACPATGGAAASPASSGAGGPESAGSRG